MGISFHIYLGSPFTPCLRPFKNKELQFYILYFNNFKLICKIYLRLEKLVKWKKKKTIRYVIKSTIVIGRKYLLLKFLTALFKEND